MEVVMSTLVKHRSSRRILPLSISWGRVFFVLAVFVLQSLGQSVKAPSATRTDNVMDILHGVEIVDPYRWLEDQNSAETRTWLDAENKYTRSILNALAGRNEIKQRLEQLSRIDVVGFPFARGGRYFFSKRSSNQDLFVIYMRKGLKGEDEVLLDPHPMSPDHTVSVGLRDVSKDGTLLAYQVREGGADETTIHFMDIDSRKNLADQMPKGRYFSISMMRDKSGFYYSRLEKEGPRVYYHPMGTDLSTDKEIFGEGYGPDKIIGAAVSDDGRYLLINVFHGSAGQKTEVYFQDLVKKGPIVTVVSDLDARFSPAIAGDHLFLQTNLSAPNGRVFDVDLRKPLRENWREVIPEGKAVVNGFSPVGGKLFVNYLENVRSVVKVFEPNGTYVRDISFPTIGSVGGVSGDWDRDEAFYLFTSFHVPTTIYRYDVKTGKQEEWSRLNVPIKTDEFEVKQVWYDSKDGTKVPMFVVHKKGLRLDGSHPTLLTGYGGFNASLTPGFSSRAAFWVERGGVYALPNLRGGGEFGEEWHRAGMLGKKQNVFDDFITAAEWLIKNGYTNPSRLVIQGGSNGGLLVGAALTQRPDLFRAVVCGYPLLDMVRYHKFLVAKFWVSEYGSSDDSNQFRYLHAYSPYHHVKQGTKYPALLMVSGDLDTRVDPLHARKMTALLQSTMSLDRPVLLHYNTKAGHSGGLPLTRLIEDLTDEMSFLFWQLGITAPGSEKPGRN